MSDIKVINLNEVTNVLGNKILSDKDFTTSELVNATVEKPVELDDVSFAFAASGSFSIQLFNSPDDQDADKVIGIAAESIIQPVANESWLKYQVKSDLKAASNVELSQLGFDIDFDIEGKRSLIFTTYRLHEKLTDKLQDTVIADFSPYLFIANSSHLKNLNPREVLAVQLPGQLSAAISLSWSDIFTGNLALIENLLGTDQLFSLELGAKIEVDFTVEIKDDFLLQVRRNASGTFELFLRKTLSKKIGGSFAAGLKIGFKEKDAVKKILGEVAEGLVSDLKGKIQPILDKNPLDKLNEDELKIVKTAAKAIGLDSDIIATAIDFENSLTEKLGKIIEQIAKSKVELGFAYEYNRMSTTDLVLQAELSEAALEKYHSGLIRFKLEPFKHHRGLLTDFRAAESAGTPLEGVTIKNYMKESKIAQTQSWGFSLGLNKWVLQGKDHKEIEETVRENLQNRRQVAFKGIREYNGALFGKEHNWKVDFNAEMERFSQNPMPLVNELKYSLFLMTQWKQPTKFKRDTLEDIVDQAVLWGVIGQEQFDTVLKQLSDVMSDSDVKNVNASVHLKINSDTFHAVISNIAFLSQHRPAHNAQRMALSLGAAMTYRREFLVRKTVAARANVYGMLWRACLLNDEVENNVKIEQEERSNLAFLAQEQLRKIGENSLAAQEINDVNSPTGRSFAGTLHMNPNVRVDWSFFRSGLLHLSNGFNQGLIYEDVVKSTFRSMQNFWTQSHYVRALGHYLLQFANNEVLLQGINRSLTISYEKNNETKVLNIVGKAK